MSITPQIIQEKLALLEYLEQVALFDTPYPKIAAIVDGLLGSIAWPGIVIPEGTLLFRCRFNESVAFFGDISELSYRRNTGTITTFGRANAPRQSVFYGSFNRPTAVGELLISQPAPQTATITMGVWMTTEVIVAGTITSAAEQIETDRLNRRWYPEAAPFILDRPNEERQFRVRLFDWASQQFTQPFMADHNQYKISAAIANYFLKRAEAVLYRSVKAPFLRFKRAPASAKDSALIRLGIADLYDVHNIGLTPKLTDDRTRFCTAVRMTMEHRGLGTYYETNSQELSGCSNGIFSWVHSAPNTKDVSMKHRGIISA